MDFGLKDRVAVVAAASKGICYAAAVELAREGARVFLCSRDEVRARDAGRGSGSVTGKTERGDHCVLGHTGTNGSDGES
jgi:3-oxoacyl-[acyl-carrier protein] reductase